MAHKIMTILPIVKPAHLVAITGYWVESEARARLEYLRGELRAERMSYGELAELQSLVPYIAAGDVELLEAAGVPEYEA